MTAQPEHKLQVSVAQMLTFGLPPSIWWTANAAGVRVLPGVAKKMKASGVRRGWPDLQIICPDGKTYPGAGCGAPPPPANPKWFGGAVNANSPVQGWYDNDSTYERATTPPCNGQMDANIPWFKPNPPPR